VVARIYIAIVLDNGCVAAIFRHCADSRRLSHPVG
jgi:hypothetical protein